MSSRRPRPPVFWSMKRIIALAERSGDPKQQRVATEIANLHALSRGSWRGRVEIVDFAGGEDRSLIMVTRLWAAGSVWRDGTVEVRDADWLLAVGLSPTFPLVMPTVQFLRPLPFNPHVVDRQFLPEPARLSSELQQWLRSEGHGGQMCYLASSQWSPDIETHNLTLVFWQASRVLTLARVHGESVSLNQPARDWCLRMRDEGRLPLGPALPIPIEVGERLVLPDREDRAFGEQGEDIEWLETTKRDTDG